MSDNVGDFTIGLDVSDFINALDKASGAAEDLQSSLDDLKDILAELESQQENTAEAFNQEVAEQYEELQAQAEAANDAMSDLDGTAEGLGSTLDDVGDDASKAGAQMGDADGKASGLGDAFQEASSHAGMLGGAIGGLISGGLSGLIDVASQAVEKVVELMLSFDEANSVLVEKTGEAGETLQQFNDIAKDTSIALDGLDVVGTAGVVGELNTRLDLTGQDLQTATVLIGKFADVTGTDAEGAVKSINGVMKTWGVETKDMNGLLDKLVVAGQKSGVSVDDLANSLGDNKYILEELGYGLDESIGLLANFEKNNIKSSTAMFGFRSAISKWSREGKNAKEGFADLSASIANATSSTEANAIAIEYLGTRAGPMVADAIRDGRWEFDYMTEAIQNSNGALADTEARSDTFSDKAEQFGDALGIIAFGGDTLQDSLSKVNDTADTMGTTVGDAVGQFLGFTDATQDVVEQSPELEEALRREQEELQKQVEFEQLANHGYETMSGNMDSIGQKIEDLNKQYEENYDTAYQNISGSIGLFDDMTIKSGKSVNKMIDSLKSQVAYMDNYASNMKKAAELGIDKGLLEKLSDGSQESAEILQSIVDDGGEHIEELNEEFGKVEEGKQNFSDTYAQMATDFDTSMGQIEARLDLAVDAMDQYQEAYDNGSDTVKGFIKGSESHYNEIYNAYKKVAERANRAVKNTLQISSPSKVMMKLGEYTAEGFAKGALDEMGTVQNAFTQIVSPPDISSPVASSSSNSITVNVPIQVSRQMTDADIQRKADMITNIVSRKFASATGGSLS